MNRLIQLFVFHAGERIDYIEAPSRSGKTEIVGAWLDSAGDVADQTWLDEISPETIRGVPRNPERQTFVVLDDYEPDPETDRAILEVVEGTPHTLSFVITSRSDPPSSFLPLIQDGTIRLTTSEQLEAARRDPPAV